MLMKRSLASAMLGLLAAATGYTAQGQGAFMFSNYASPYVPIAYDEAIPGVGGHNAGPGEGVIIEVWWASGAGRPESALVFEGATANFSRYAGYTDRFQVFTIPGFTGQPRTYTAQLRASGLAGGLTVDSQRSRGPLINVEVANQSGLPELPVHTRTPGFTVFVPEPSTFALVGLGAAALWIFRRRDQSIMYSTDSRTNWTSPQRVWTG
jgi:hypothetical protein